MTRMYVPHWQVDKYLSHGWRVVYRTLPPGNAIARPEGAVMERRHGQ